MRHAIEARSGLRYVCGEPRNCYRSWREGLDEDAEGLLLVDFEVLPWWLDGADPLPLTALYAFDAGRLRVAVTDSALVDAPLTSIALFEHWVDTRRLLATEPGAALELLPTSVAKPWGRELWYSAVERRGVCRAGVGTRSSPLPWLQVVLPDNAAGAPEQSLVLLKILEPSPEPVMGELYFELHLAKREVYVVTDIDPVAWPDGTGFIRYGFSQDKRTDCGDDQRFLADYLAAVKAYEAVRRTLDTPGEEVEQDAALLHRERLLRQEMDSFTHLRPLRRGDVVVVPPGLPHALLHGVRVIEFQTPVYERSILSFAQQVQTQAHWDTEVALENALLEPPALPPFTQLDCGAGVQGETIVQFRDFEVTRYRIEKDCGYTPGPLVDYGLVMVLSGELCLTGQRYGSGQALLLTRGWTGMLTPARAGQALDLLLAIPCA